MNMAKSLLIARKLSKYYWAEAVVCSVYILNRSPTSSVQGKVSEEKWSGSKVNVSHLRIFGCVYFAHVPEEIRNIVRFVLSISTQNKWPIYQMDVNSAFLSGVLNE
jgi:hypothetical protein